MKSVSLVITLYVERTLMLNGSFIVHSFRLSPFTIMEANDAKSLYCTTQFNGDTRKATLKNIQSNDKLQKAKNRQDSKFKMKNDAREITGYYRAPFVSFTSGGLNGRKRFGRGR